MLAIQLKNYLNDIPDEANIMIYTKTDNETRQLLMRDIDRHYEGDVIIDAEYKVPAKKTVITEEIIKENITQIMSKREKILEAFIAETGLKPSECEQVMQGNRWWVKRRT